MSLDPKHIGKKYGPFRYQAGLEKMREFAYAVCGGFPSVGTTSPPEGLNPLLYDEEAARKGPHGTVVAFPTFAVTFAIAPFAAALTDPELGVNLLRLVHGEQDFEFHELIRPGDVMTTTGTITQIQEKGGNELLTLQTESVNQDGKLVVRGTWSAFIRRPG